MILLCEEESKVDLLGWFVGCCWVWRLLMLDVGAILKEGRIELCVRVE